MESREAELSLAARVIQSTTFRWLSVIGAVITVVSFIVSVPPIQEALFEKHSELSVEVLSEVPLLDLRQRVGDLQVQLQGRDLIASGQNLIASRVSIKNTGQVSITPARMSAADPLGFRIENGAVVRLSGMRATTEHLRRLAQPMLRSNQITISEQVIIDPGDSIDLDILTIVPNRQRPRYIPIGKIEGVTAIRLIDQSTTGDRESFLSSALAGSILVHAFRLLFYTVILIGLITITIGAFSVGDSMSRKRKRSQRQEVANRIRASLAELSEDVRVFVLDLYVSIGWRQFKSFGKKIHITKTKLAASLDSPNPWRRELDYTRLDGESTATYVKRMFKADGVSYSFALRVASEIGLVDREKMEISEMLGAAVSKVCSLLSVLNEQAEPLERYDPPRSGFDSYLDDERFRMRTEMLAEREHQVRRKGRGVG